MATHSLKHRGNRSMASVKIDLGFGEQAILSESAASEALQTKHQQDAEEFLRRWPRTRSIHQERGYLQQLGLHAGFHPSGVNPSDTAALLRSAVKSGKVIVVIERTATGGGIRASQPTSPPYPLAARQKAARVAPTRKSPSYDWLPRYDDVTAGDLIAYLEDVIRRTPGTATVPETDSSTPLGDAQPFEYSEDSPLQNVDQVAMRGVSEEDEAECHAMYEMDMEQCEVAKAMYGGDLRTHSLCTTRAFENYQACRGY